MDRSKRMIAIIGMVWIFDLEHKHHTVSRLFWEFQADVYAAWFFRMSRVQDI